MAETVADFLQLADLTVYAEAFEEQGWDSLAALRVISDEELAQLIIDVSMKSGHVSARLPRRHWRPRPRRARRSRPVPTASCW